MMTSNNSLLISALITISPAAAQSYKWVDQDGVTHYSNTAPRLSVQAETHAEAKVGPSGSTNDLSDVLESYQLYEIHHRRNDRSNTRSKPTGKGETMAD